MRISVTEWSALKLAIRLPRALINPELFAQTVREHARTRRGLAAIGLALLIVLVLLHVKTADPAVTRLTNIVALLAGAKSIDAPWDAAALQARTEESASAPAIQSTDRA